MERDGREAGKFGGRLVDSAEVLRELWAEGREVATQPREVHERGNGYKAESEITGGRVWEER